MQCPYCNKEIHFEDYDNMIHRPDEDEFEGIEIAYGLCPSCYEIIILFREGVTSDDQKYLESISSEKIIYPISGVGRQLPPDVPEEYRNEFNEASVVLQFSAKASAALSRRCLQQFLEDEMKIKKGNLLKEIEEFINNNHLPSVIIEAVDAIRNIGNFAAHPLKDTNTGEIVDVEPGEAEWLLEVLETLFDYHFVQPLRLQKKKELLNIKLAALNKPLMK